MKALSCSANVNVNNLEFHGGLTGDLLNLLKGLIKSHINSSMSSTLCSELTTVVGGAFNKVLDSFTYELQLDLPGALNISSAEFGLMGDPVITSSCVHPSPARATVVCCMSVPGASSHTYVPHRCLHCDSYVGVDLIGEVVNRDKPETPPFQPPTLPAFQSADADHMLQLYISRYVFNSGAWVFFQVGYNGVLWLPRVRKVAQRAALRC